MREDLGDPDPDFAGSGALDAFDGYRSGDEYDREAITHVMACSSHLPGYLLQGYA